MEDLAFRKDAISAGTCISKGLEVLFNNVFTLVAGAFLFSFIFAIASIIPFIGSMLSFFLLGVTYAGFYYFTIRRIDGKSATLSDLFAGFSSVGSVFGVVLVQLLAYLIIMGILWLLLYFTGTTINFAPGEFGVFPSYGGIAVVSVIGFIISVFFRVIFYFPLMLVMDKKISAGAAISQGYRASSRNILGLILLNILQGLVLVGFSIILAILSGVLFNLLLNSMEANAGDVGFGGILSTIIFLPGMVILYTIMSPFIACTDAAAYREVFPEGA